jgi:transposase
MSVEQKPLVQEVIEAAGSRLCTFLPKYHCELNFIEFFWSVVKRYFRENCDYTFETLKTHLPSAYGNITCTCGWRLKRLLVRS